jgi:DNA repair exonuclease SbcCD ATPase subunit
MPTPLRDQFLDLPEGDPLSAEHLDEKVQQAEQQEQSLKRQLETIEKQKRELEELSRRQDLLTTGRNDVADKLTRALVIVERETLDAGKRLELLQNVHAAFAQHLENIEGINPKSWGEGMDINKELTRALAAVDDARGEYNRSFPKVSAIPEHAAADSAIGGSSTADYSTGDGRDFLTWMKMGLAFSLPLIVLGLIGLIVIISRLPAK